MEIIPNMKQVLLNAVPFLVAIVGMYKIILKPMLDHLIERGLSIDTKSYAADRRGIDRVAARGDA